MRWQIKAAFALGCGLVVLGLAVGDAPMQTGGSAAGKSAPDPVALLHNASVKKELRLSEEQVRTVDAAIWNLLKGVLDNDQFARLKQIDLQQRDYRAFNDPEVQAQLALNGDQKDVMNILLGDLDKEITALLKPLSAPDGAAGAPAAFDKIRALETETRARCTEVLTDDQKRVWLEMIGEPFNLLTPRDTFKDFKIPIGGGEKGAAKGDAGGKAKGGGKKKGG